MASMPKSEKGNNSVKCSQYFMKSSVGHLHYVSKPYDRYDHSSSYFVHKVALLCQIA